MDAAQTTLINLSIVVGRWPGQLWVRDHSEVAETLLGEVRESLKTQKAADSEKMRGIVDQIRHLSVECEKEISRRRLLNAVTSSPATSISTGSDLPLGCAAHSERSTTSHRRDEVDKDVQMFPPSPSPSKVSAKTESRYQEGLIPSFDLPVPRRKCKSTTSLYIFGLTQPLASDTRCPRFI